MRAMKYLVAALSLEIQTVRHLARRNVLPTRSAEFLRISSGNAWLGGRDSNPDKQSQSLLSYRWTTSQNGREIRQETPIIDVAEPARQARRPFPTPADIPCAPSRPTDGRTTSASSYTRRLEQQYGRDRGGRMRKLIVGALALGF